MRDGVTTTRGTVSIGKRSPPTSRIVRAYGVWRHRLRFGLPDGSLHTLFLQTDDAAEHDVMDGEGFLIFDENGLGVESGCPGPGRKLLGQRFDLLPPLTEAI